MIEPLESRIAPATLSLIDVDGDLVSIVTSKGTNAQLATAVTLSAAGVPGGMSIDTINLASNVVFDGTDLAVSGKVGPLGGDGFVNVGKIDATGLDLGVVKIGGALTDAFKAGKNTPASTVQKIDAHAVRRLLDAKVC